MSGGFDELRANVQELLGGLEAAVTLVVDLMLPTSRLVDAVRTFEDTVPTVSLDTFLTQ